VVDVADVDRLCQQDRRRKAVVVVADRSTASARDLFVADLDPWSQEPNSHPLIIEARARHRVGRRSRRARNWLLAAAAGESTDAAWRVGRALIVGARNDRDSPHDDANRAA
jgi:hypothetical protein